MTDALENWLDRDERPRIKLTSGRQVVWANRSARNYLKSPMPIYIRRDCLCMADRKRLAILDRSLDAIGSEQQRITIFAAPGKVAAVITAYSSGEDEERFIYLVFAIPYRSVSIGPSGMAEIFRFTPAETRVVEAISRFEHASAIAERLGISVHTVRSHIRAIFDKTSVCSQIELVRLVAAYEGG